MSEGYFLAPGVEAAIEQMVVPKAQQLAAFLASRAHPCARLVGLRFSAASDRAEAVVFDVDVEVGQEPVHGILPVERVAVSFRASDLNWPEVLALRMDFPRDVSHLFPTPDDTPCSLCLYEDSYDELKLAWTAPRIVERIRFWLRETSRGTLHAPDQPVERLFAGRYESLVLPPSLFSVGAIQPMRISVARCDSGVQGSVYIASETDAADPGTGFVATVFAAPPSAQGAIRLPPQDLFELDTMTRSAGLDLLHDLRTRIREWHHNGKVLQSRMILVIVFPKTRGAGSPVEVSDIWAFALVVTVAEIGQALALWQVDSQGVIGHLIGAKLERASASKISVKLLNPHFALTRGGAAAASGFCPDARRIVAIGIGALGSQIVGNLIRTGYGLWQFVDEDVLLPHNTARHELPYGMVGLSKVRAMTEWSNALLSEPVTKEGIVADVLNPGDQADALESALQEGDVIADFSASVAVARHLARDVTASARRVTAFLNPTGTDMVVLAEDTQRRAPIDCVEMQYYRALLKEPKLANHLATPLGRIRTGRSCRDVSTVLSGDLVSLHAALASRGIRNALAQDEARIAIWSTDTDLSTSAIQIQVAPAVEVKRSGYRLFTDKELIGQLRALRAEKLPLETGGVLLGSWDLQRRIVYVVAMIPSPVDSEECPDSYVRGCEGLLLAVREAEERTGGQIRYVGEWHSHPDGYSSNPSDHDHDLLAWLHNHVGKEGLPPVMLIVGEIEMCWVVGSL